MIITEFYTTRADNVNLYRTYSNSGFRIRQKETGVVYDEAIDVEGKYTYEETDIPIAEEENPVNQDLHAYADAGRIALGEQDYSLE